ncbi:MULTISPECIES: excalibur calcium-binding domain-containing protein [Rhodococcus]|nr:excalibur calcium-binding domain-containing protein [Rhodococcus pyridinivorans]MCD2119553.1 excalibur calcium-binding domain-containing protein [Rhodococcus pyridinivorans]MCZ4627676.1 excalibur calcium-binding domain-containing protein [Rhodococcus pyridinivorans]MCZ4648719.1 excalibur calcium-binding domain-containing protein [Rhodococcus pyridinivorans]MDJ0481429.1 excalibur calcium-binding domain-containing protein [Rhodococcus pyridinivorans]
MPPRFCAGNPRYAPYLDGDNEGIACDK